MDWQGALSLSLSNYFQGVKDIETKGSEVITQRRNEDSIFGKIFSCPYILYTCDTPGLSRVEKEAEFLLLPCCFSV